MKMIFVNDPWTDRIICGKGFVASEVGFCHFIIDVGNILVRPI